MWVSVCVLRVFVFNSHHSSGMKRFFSVFTASGINGSCVYCGKSAESRVCVFPVATNGSFLI